MTSRLIIMLININVNINGVHDLTLLGNLEYSSHSPAEATVNATTTHNATHAKASGLGPELARKELLIC
jgi:hypothetical protein